MAKTGMAGEAEKIMEYLTATAAFFNENAGAITAIATGAIALLTYVLAQENRRLRKAGTEPEVVAYLIPHPDGNGGVNFVLANIGQGPARNIRFEFEYDQEDFKNHEVMLFNDPKRAHFGILPQGERLSILFGISFKLVGSSPLKPFKVNISYDNLAGKTCTPSQTLDVSQFSGLRGLLAKPASRDIADSLQKIEKHLGALVKKASSTVDLLDTTPMSSECIQRVPIKKPENTESSPEDEYKP